MTDNIRNVQVGGAQPYRIAIGEGLLDDGSAGALLASAP